MTSFACECGYVKFMKVDVKANKVIYNFSTRFGNYISRVQIFTENNGQLDNFPKEDLWKSYHGRRKVEGGTASNKVNLVVVNTILPAVVFQ